MRLPRSIRPGDVLPDFFATVLCKRECGKREKEGLRAAARRLGVAGTSRDLSHSTREKPPKIRLRNPGPHAKIQTPRSAYDQGACQRLYKSFLDLELLAP